MIYNSKVNTCLKNIDVEPEDAKGVNIFGLEFIQGQKSREKHSKLQFHMEITFHNCK